MLTRPTSVVLSLLLLAGCGTDDTSTAGTPPPATQREPTTSTPAEPTPTTTSAATTTTSTTTVPTTAVPSPTTTSTTSTTTSPAATTGPAAGWTAVEAESVSALAFPPCCAETWRGEVSPALAPEGEPLADGPDAVVARWPAPPVEVLELEVFRFDRCAVLPAESCDGPSSAVEYGPDELGVDPSTARRFIVPLDGEVDVVVVGWDDGPPGDFVVEEATGTELAVLANEVERAYAEVFGERLVTGEAPDVIVADVLADPTGGFVPSEVGYQSSLFRPSEGPPLLVQGVFPYVDATPVAGRGTDLLRVVSTEVVDGRLTLYVYAAYVP